MWALGVKLEHYVNFNIFQKKPPVYIIYVETEGLTDYTP